MVAHEPHICHFRLESVYTATVQPRAGMLALGVALSHVLRPHDHPTKHRGQFALPPITGVGKLSLRNSRGHCCQQDSLILTPRVSNSQPCALPHLTKLTPSFRRWALKEG